MAKRFFVWVTDFSVEVVNKWERKRRKIIGLQQLNARLPPCLFFFVPSARIFRAKVVYMVLGSSYLSARKILSRERS